jgi:thioredoxin 1
MMGPPVQVYECPCCEARGRPLLLGVFVAAVVLAGWIKMRGNKKGGGAMNATWKILVVVGLGAAVGAVFALRQNAQHGEPPVADAESGQVTEVQADSPKDEGKPDNVGLLPRLVDLGAGTCIPCKMMVPVLDELKKEYAGRLSVEFYDVREDPSVGAKYGIRVIPTQIFYDAAGKELFRHEGFIAKEDILAKFKECGVDLAAGASQPPTFERLVPAKTDDRPKESICYMCDGDIDPKTLVTVATDKGPVRLCSPHCYFIMQSCLTQDKTDFETKVTVTDWTTGTTVAISQVTFLYGQDEATGRPWIRAFAGRDAATAERAASGGNMLALEPLRQKEMSHRCGFCDRACYPQDAAEVIVDGGVRTWGCCSHCALGVAARTGKDIEVHEKDRLTKQAITVKTFDGKVASLQPSTAVAWFGQRQRPDGTWGSAGCFHQGFFVNADNLKKWVTQNPYQTGRLISIRQALANKMKLSPEEIQKACKIGECVPK